MSIAAIICEYNPFHDGHRYQIGEIRQRLGETTGVLCLMSGNYVQRGEPAVFDKWNRARTAVEGGADLVLELPITAAVNSAGYFASGAVQCLEKLGGVDFLCFGSEGEQTETLLSAAQTMETPEFEKELRERLATGVSYARARELALSDLGGKSACLNSPNNALGTDYLRALIRLDSLIRPIAIPRKEDIPSATDLRKELTGNDVHRLEYGERAMLAVLRSLPDEAFEVMPFGSEGLWSKVMRACRREDSLAQILAACKTKRYTMSRLKRMLLCLYLGLSEEEMSREIPYIRVLAFRDRGREMLRELKKSSGFPLVSGSLPNDPLSAAYFDLEVRATDLYRLFATPGTLDAAGRERTEGPVYVRKEGIEGVVKK